MYEEFLRNTVIATLLDTWLTHIASNEDRAVLFERQIHEEYYNKEIALFDKYIFHMRGHY